MTDKPDGGPAFPVPGSWGTEYESNGMTYRAWVAGQAMAGLLACPTMCAEMTAAEYAETACEVADALIAELAK